MPKGFAEDCRKYNAATLLGWRVYRVTGDMVRTWDAINVAARALESAAGCER